MHYFCHESLGGVWRVAVRYVIAAACLTFLAGCKNANQRPAASISGRVTLDGAPLSAASIQFTSPKTGESAYANLDADGRYKVTFPQADLGADYEVSFGPPVDEDVDATALAENPQPRATSPIPKKYTERTTSGLKANVATAGDNTFDVQLLSR